MPRKKSTEKKQRAKGKPRPYKQQNQSLPAGQLADRHDPKFDLDTLTRAEEIRADKMRHGAAKVEAGKRHSILSSVMEGAKSRDEGEMERYAKKRRPPTGGMSGVRG